MIWLRRSLALFLVLLLVLLFLLASLGTRIEATLLDTDFLKGTLEEAEVYTAAVDGAEELVREQLEDGEITEEFPLTVDEVAGLLREVLPPEWLQEQAERAIDAVVPFLTGDTEEFEFTVDLEGRRGLLVDGLLTRLAERYNQLPACSRRELLALSTQEGFPTCRAPDVPFGEVLERFVVRQQLEAQLQEVIPDQFTLDDADVRGEFSEIGDLRDLLGRARQGLQRLPILLLVLVLLIALIGGRGIWGRLQWTSAALVVASGVTLASVTAVLMQRERILDQLRSALQDAEAPLSLRDSAQSIVEQVVEGIFGHIQGQVLLVLLPSLVVLVVSLSLPPILRWLREREGR